MYFVSYSSYFLLIFFFNKDAAPESEPMDDESEESDVG